MPSLDHVQRPTWWSSPPLIVYNEAMKMYSKTPNVCSYVFFVNKLGTIDVRFVACVMSFIDIHNFGSSISA